MKRHVFLLLLTAFIVLAEESSDAKNHERHSANDVKRYSPSAAAGKLGRNQDTFWDFWLRQFNPRRTDYGALLEEKRRRFLARPIRPPRRRPAVRIGPVLPAAGSRGAIGGGVGRVLLLQQVGRDLLEEA